MNVCECIFVATGYWPKNCGFWEQHGASFPTSNWTNYSDNSTIFNDKCGYSREPNFFDTSENGQNFICDCWYILDKYMETSCCRILSEPEAIVFNFLMGILAILFWTRVLYFYETHQRLGPLLKVIGHMIDDVRNYIVISLLFAVGFGLAVRAIIGNGSSQFYDLSATGLYMFKSIFMKIDFKVLNACGDDATDLCNDGGWLSEWRSSLAQILMCIYLVIALCMMRILVAMFAATYNKSIKQAGSQVMYARLKLAYELNKSSGIIPAPLTIIAFNLALIWIVMDLFSLILINRFIDIENMGWQYKHNHRANKPKQPLTKGEYFLGWAKPGESEDMYHTRVYKGIKLLLGGADDKKWVCNYCGQRNHNNISNQRDIIQEYLEGFIPRNDTADEKVVKVYNPEICVKCYRSRQEIRRSQIILREISFLVFMVVCYPVIVLLTCIPALISKLIDSIKGCLKASNMNQNNETNMDNVDKAHIKRQIGQMKHHWKSIPKFDHQRSINKRLTSIIETSNIYADDIRSKDNVTTPEINKIVDTVITDNSPINKVQIRIEDLYGLLQNMAKLQLEYIKKSSNVHDIHNDSNDNLDKNDENKDDLKTDSFITAINNTTEALKNTQNKQNDSNMIDDIEADKQFVVQMNKNAKLYRKLLTPKNNDNI